jgi:D-alanyl-D-alanine carboxypeptidase
MDLKKGFKLIILIVFISSIFVSVVVNILDNSQKTQYVYYQNLKDIKKPEQDDLQKIINNTTAQGVLVYDLSNNNILGFKNIEKTYSLASLTKIITAATVYEKDKNLLNEIRSMLKTSSNPEAEKLALVFGPDEKSQVEYMNNFTQKYNLHFRNVSGLDIEINKDGNRIAGGEAKPMDLINFIKEYYIKYPEIFDETILKKDNTNTITDDLDFLTFSKTGFTNLSGGNLLVSIQLGLGREIFILVLNSTEKNRFVDVQNIANFLVQSSI